MTVTRPLQGQPWRLAIVAVVGLVIGLIAIGVVGLIVNARMGQVVADAIAYDIELEEEADDLRTAVFDLQAYHRLIALDEPSPLRAEGLEDRRARLVEEIDELEAIGRIPPQAPRPEELRTMLDGYYADFSRAVDAFVAGELSAAAFDEASDRGLEQLSELERAAGELDALGEELGEAAFANIEEERRTALFVLGGFIIGVGILAIVVGIGVVFMVREGRRLLTVAAEAAQAKDDFIADASHELRTPLTVLRGNAEQALVLGARAPRDLFEDIASEAVRMSRLVDDLLLLARSDAAGLPLALERVEAEPFLTEMAARAEKVAAEQGSTLSADVAADAMVEVDPARIEQALTILVDNAAKYGRGGRIELRAEVRDSRLNVAVRDEGPGIPPEALPHIFERFYRVDRTRARTSGGAGLGLAIAKSIVTAHRGDIVVDTAVGRGTTMTVVLPIVRRGAATE
jgi:signal transduction histidine kinase